MTRQPVVVLGASGFIGRRIVAALATSDWATPIAVSRRIASFPTGGEVERVALDATDQSKLEGVIASATGVVNCVAGSAEDIVRSGTALLHAAARITSPPRVIYLSSLSAYGSARGTVDETSPLLADLGDYSASKAAVDRLAAGYPFAVRLRPGIVYGPESPWWTDRIARLLVARRLGDLGTTGNGICNLVHVEDVVAAVLQALKTKSAAGEAFNLGSPEPPTWNEYFRRYAQTLHATPLRRISRARMALELGVYGPALKVIEKILERAGRSLAQPALRPWLTQLCRHDIRLDVRKAEQQLSMKWRPLEVGLKECATWFLAGNRT